MLVKRRVVFVFQSSNPCIKHLLIVEVNCFGGGKRMKMREKKGKDENASEEVAQSSAGPIRLARFAGARQHHVTLSSAAHMTTFPRR